MQDFFFMNDYHYVWHHRVTAQSLGGSTLQRELACHSAQVIFIQKQYIAVIEFKNATVL